MEIRLDARARFTRGRAGRLPSPARVDARVGVQANPPVAVGASERSVIGILGGTFDPIHVGHIALARAALRELNLAQVRFLPAAQPWQKTGVTDAAHRAQMVQLAIASEPRC